MIEILSQLTMSQFIDLLCGDVAVLSPGNATKQEVEKVRTHIIYDFTKLSDPASAARFFNRQTRQIKHKAALQLFQICHNLLEIYAYDEVRDILAQYGIRSASMSVDALKAEVEGQIKRVERDIAVEDKPEDESKEQSPDEIRQSYDRQCASLMTYFKFQIDMNTIKASQFACMIDQATREIKAKQALLSKKR